MLLRHQRPFGSSFTRELRLFLCFLLLCVPFATVNGQEEDSPAANRLANEAANLQNKGQFAVAADVWDEYLQKFPQSSLAPKARYYSGVCHMKVGQLEKAIGAFTVVVEEIKDHPEYPYNEDALLNLGGCYLSRADQSPDSAVQDYQQAAAMFGRLAREYPEGKYIDQATYFLAEAFYLGGKIEMSIPLYAKLVDQFEDSAFRSIGLYALAVALDESGKRETALARYDAFLKDYPEDDLATDVAMRRGEVLLQQAQSLDESGQGTPEAWEAARTAFAKLATSQGFGQADRAIYQQAFCESKLGRAGEAAKLYDVIIQKFPESLYLMDARLAAGRTNYQLQQFDAARTALQPLIESNDDRRGQAGHWIAKCWLEQGEPQRALDLTRQWVAAWTTDAYLPYLILDQADAAFAIPAERGQSRDLYLRIAREFFDHPLAPQALYNAAFEDFEAQRTEEALQLTGEFLERYATNSFAPDVRALRGECELKLGQPDEAETTYRELLEQVKQHPERERWPLRLALCQYAQKKYDKTIATLTAIDRWSQPAWEAEANYLIGASAFYSEDYEKAIAALTRATQQKSAWNQADIAMVLLARSQARLKQEDAAEATLKAVLTEFPESSQSSEVWFRLGEVSESQGRPEEAQKWYQKLLVDQPGSPLAPYARIATSWLSFDSEQWESAANGFQGLLAADPNHPLADEAQLGLGMSQRQAGQFDAAVTTLTAYLKRDPLGVSSANGRFELAMAYLGQKDYPKAAEELTQLLEVHPQWERADQALYQLAWAAKYQEQTDTATQFFRRLVDEQDSSPLVGEAWFHLGEAAYEDSDYETASQRYAKAVELAGSDLIRNNASYKQAWTQFKSKDWDTARESFSQLGETASEPLKSQAQFMSAECRYEAKQFEPALQGYQACLEKLESMSEVSDAMKQLARLHASQSANQQKQADLAYDLAKVFLEKYPESPSAGEAWFEIGMAENARKAPDKAIAAFEEATLSAAPAVAARARFMVGEVHFAAERYSEATKQFNRVMFGFGDDAAPEVAQWQAVAGFEAGRCYHVQIAAAKGEAQKQLLDQAVEAYQYVVDQHPNNRLAAEAGKQIKQLKAFKP
jgi:TolA-binding protein